MVRADRWGDDVGISSDFDGGGGVSGWNDASETFNVTLELVLRGYTETQIEKLWSGNLLRVMGKVQSVADLHGYGHSRAQLLPHADFLHQAGFSVLLFDFRAHGRSAGTITTFGFLERWDVLGAVKFLQDRQIHRIGLLGFSLGGISAILSTAI